jgi:choline kinase
VHPVSVERTLLAARERLPRAGLILAIDTVKPLAEEEMKVILDHRGLLRQISKLLDPAQAHGEYIGATLIEPVAAISLADALEVTWRRDPGLYYEDGYQELARRGGAVVAAPIGDISWVEVDNHADLARARQIAPAYSAAPAAADAPEAPSPA